MPQDEKPDKYWDEVDTPDPNEFAVAVFIKDTFIRGRMSTFPVGTKLRLAPDFFPRMPTGTQEYGEYEFMKRAKSGDGYVVYYFGKPKSDLEKKTPFRRIPSCKDHRWPMVVHGISKVEMFGMGRSSNGIGVDGEAAINTGPEYDMKEAVTQEVNEGTKHIVEEFLSPTMFNIPHHRVPVPQSMKVVLPGFSRTFPECLHPKLVVHDSIVANNQIIAGTASAFGSSINGQLFPATNFEDWLPYYKEDDQKQLDSGLWYRWRIRVFPPIKPDNVIQ